MFLPQSNQLNNELNNSHDVTLLHVVRKLCLLLSLFFYIMYRVCSETQGPVLPAECHSLFASAFTDIKHHLITQNVIMVYFEQWKLFLR